MPAGTETPLHLIAMLDLRDPDCPVSAEPPVRYLPFYYPLKYGWGGPSVQYDVLSDSEIRILHMSDEKPDPEEQQYVQVPHLPQASARLLPIRYEEAKILEFAGGYFSLNDEDSAVLAGLCRDHPLIRIGRHKFPVNGGDVICRNPTCEFFERRTSIDMIASIPPIAVGGVDDFWYEYQGGDMEFHFGLCRYCRTVLAFNTAS